MALTRLGPNNSTNISGINLTSQVTGTLPVASGGTGLTSGTTDQLLKFTGSTTLASSAISTGKVLQIVQGTSTSQFSTSSTSFVKCTQISATITPSASSSKILIHIMGTVQTEQYTRDLFMDICRNIGGGSDTFLSGVNSGFLRKYDGGTTIEIVNGNMNYLDSPNTSSSIVYTPAIRFGGGNTPGAEFGESNIKQTITLTEISA